MKQPDRPARSHHRWIDRSGRTWLVVSRRSGDRDGRSYAVAVVSPDGQRLAVVGSYGLNRGQALARAHEAAYGGRSWGRC